MGVVNEAIQDGVGDGGIGNEIVPFGHGKLSGDEGRFALVALFDDFEQMEALLVGQRMVPQSSRMRSCTRMRAREACLSWLRAAPKRRGQSEMLHTPYRPYRWATEPPIEVVTDWDKLQVICNQFKAEAQMFEPPATDDEAMSNDRKQRAACAADRIRFEVAALISFEAAALVRSEADALAARDRRTFCIYKPSGKVVGLMSWDHGSEAESVVRSLAMLPGRESEGAILVEYAVNLSEKAGREGSVHFWDFNDNGWRYRQPWLQYLESEIAVPHEEKDTWVKVGNKWRLKKLLLPHWRRAFLGREITGKIGPIPRLPGQPKF